MPPISFQLQKNQNNMAAQFPSQKQLETAMEQIDSIYGEFQKELARLKKEKIQIIDQLNKHADDKRIQEILKKIR